MRKAYLFMCGLGPSSTSRRKSRHAVVGRRDEARWNQESAESGRTDAYWAVSMTRSGGRRCWSLLVATPRKPTQ